MAHQYNRYIIAVRPYVAYIDVLVLKYGISNTIVLEIP